MEVEPDNRVCRRYQFKYGDRMGMRVALVLGPEEQASDQVAIKDLRSGEQATYPQAEAAKIIQQILARSPAS